MVSYDVDFSCIDGRGSSCFFLSRTGAVGILNAKTVNDERYMRAYCSEEDNSERVWLYWMTGSSAATILFCLFGTFTFILGVFLFSTLRTQNYNITTPGSAAPQAGDQIEMKDHEAVVRTDKEDKEALADDKDKNLRQNMIATAIAVPMIMFFSSVALLSCKSHSNLYMVSAGRCDGMFAPTNPRK